MDNSLCQIIAPACTDPASLKTALIAAILLIVLLVAAAFAFVARAGSPRESAKPNGPNS